MKKYFQFSVFIVCGSLMLISLFGCSAINSYQKSIYDDNVKIGEKADSYSFKSRISSAYSKQLSIKIDSFYGKQGIWEIEAVEDSVLNLTIQANIKSGKFKVCLIDQNKSVSLLAEGTAEDTFSSALTKGKYIVAIVGNGANGQVDASLSADDNVSIRKIDNH